jgi:CyaY protein
MDDRQFTTQADLALEDLYRRLNAAAEKHDFEADFNGGVLAVEFEDPPAKFVVSPNSVVRQIWVSAHSKSSKLDWDEARGEFVLNGAKSLRDTIAEAVTQQIGEAVTL